MSLVNADFMVLTPCSILLSIAAAVVFMASVALDNVDAWGNGAGGKASAAVATAAAVVAVVAAGSKGGSSATGAAVVTGASVGAGAGTWSNGFGSIDSGIIAGDAGANTDSADACGVSSKDAADGVGNAFRSESAGRPSSLLSDACMSDSIVILRRLSVMTFTNQSIISLDVSSPWYSFGFAVLILLM